MESSPPVDFLTTQYSMDIKAPDFSINPHELISSPDGFFITFELMECSESYYYEREANEWNFHSTITMQTNCVAFHASRDAFSEMLSACLEISNMLDELNIPMSSQVPLITRIYDAIFSLANDPIYAAPKVIPILIRIVAQTFYDITDLSLSEGPKYRPAAKSAIESLAKVKFDAQVRETTCVICLEDFVVDAELISMPCKHVYHGECITKWLKQNNLCPLCRFEMPVDPSE